MTRLSKRAIGMVCLALLAAAEVRAQEPPVQELGDSVRVRFVDADLRAVVQALAQYLPKPVMLGGLTSVRVTLEAPGAIPRTHVVALLRGLLASHGLDLVDDSTFFRVAQHPAQTASAAVGSGSEGRDVGLFVLRLKHARAADVAATVTQLFGLAGEFAGPRVLSGGTLTEELRDAGARSDPRGAGASSPAATAPRQATLGGAVTIVPDELTNSLLVRGSPSDYALLQEAVAFLDVRPLQVLIEVLIVEARQDRMFSLGADWLLPPQPIGEDGSVAAQLTGGGLGDLILHIMKLGTFDLEGVLRTAASRGDVRIVSRPVLLASNNSEARFLVGSQRPFIQVSRSLPTDTPSRDQVVQYKDVGTRLTVLPTINDDGYVSLQIQQEVNAATNETQFDAPVISTREASTRVLVRDGQTIVLGGMRDRQQDRVHSGVPILSDVPLIGGLFGATTTRTTETELFLFITPRILRTDADADSVTAPRLPKVPADHR